MLYSHVQNKIFSALLLLVSLLCFSSVAQAGTIKFGLSEWNDHQQDPDNEDLYRDCAGEDTDCVGDVFCEFAVSNDDSEWEYTGTWELGVCSGGGPDVVCIECGRRKKIKEPDKTLYSF